MKAVIFTTVTPDTEKLIRSFTSLGHDTETVRYDVPGFDMIGFAKAARPDVIIYIGAVGEFHGGLPVPSTDILAQVGRVAPMIHLCSDPGDHPWWPLLEEYHAAKAFRLQVGIDG